MTHISDDTVAGANDLQMHRAADVLLVYAQRVGADESNFRDLLADLMHYADTYGLDFYDELRIARDNYLEELGA